MNHLNKHTAQGELSCIKCGHQAPDKHALAQHLTTSCAVPCSGNKEILACSQCNTLRYKHLLKKHEALHNIQSEEEAPHLGWTCPHCGKFMKGKDPKQTKLSKKRHLELHEGTLHPCPTCKRLYRSRRALQAHRRKHDAPRIKCTKCPYQTYRRGIMQKHMEIHRNDRETFPCDQCGRFLMSKVVLKYHVKRVHNR